MSAARQPALSIEERVEQARKELCARPREQRQIALALSVHYNWVRRFASGVLREPGAVKFAHLEDWLAEHPRAAATKSRGRR